jgi:hypothetical protein
MMAIMTFPTWHMVGDDDPVPFFEFLDSSPDFHRFSDEFMPQHDRFFWERTVDLENIRSTKATRTDFEEDFSGADFGDGEFLDVNGLVGMVDGSAHIFFPLLCKEGVRGR